MKKILKQRNSNEVECLMIKYECEHEKHHNHALHGVIDRALVTHILENNKNISRDEVYLFLIFFQTLVDFILQLTRGTIFDGIL